MKINTIERFNPLVITIENENELRGLFTLIGKLESAGFFLTELESMILEALSDYCKESIT